MDGSPNDVIEKDLMITYSHKAEQDYCANNQDQTKQMATDRLLYDSNGDPLFMSPKWIYMKQPTSHFVRSVV